MVMEALHLPDNIKVHFASMENLVQYQIIHTLGVNYFLYTAYPFVSRLLKSRSKILTTNICDIYQVIANT